MSLGCEFTPCRLALKGEVGNVHWRLVEQDGVFASFTCRQLDTHASLCANVNPRAGITRQKVAHRKSVDRAH